MLRRLKRNIAWILLFAAAIALLIVGSFFDLQISEKLASLSGGAYYSDNGFAVGVEILSELPTFFLVAFCLFIIFLGLGSCVENRVIAALLKIFCLVSAALVSYYAAQHSIEYSAVNGGFEGYLTGALAYVSYALCGAILTLSAYFAASRLKAETLNRLFWWAVVAVIAIGLGELAVQVLKHLMPRVRYRAMSYIGDFSVYTRWYQRVQIEPQTKAMLLELVGKDAIKSFPSGHTASAASLITLALLPRFLPQLEKTHKKVLLWTAPTAYSALVALSRIIAGAHFLSDVAFGFGIMAFIIFSAQFIFGAIISRASEKNQKSANSTVNRDL